MSLSLTHEILDPTSCSAAKMQNFNSHFLAGGEARARLLKSANSALKNPADSSSVLNEIHLYAHALAPRDFGRLRHALRIRPQTLPICPFGDAPFAEMSAQE